MHSHPTDPLVLSLADRTILAAYDHARCEDGSISWQLAEPAIYHQGVKAKIRGDREHSGYTDHFLDAAWRAGWNSR